MRRTLITFIFVLLALDAAAWGNKGHQVIAYIAKRHLSKEAAARINQILDNNSIVYYASWLDQVVRDEEYKYTSTWHYINVDEGQAYEERESLAYIDAVQALERMTALLTNPDATDAEQEFALKVIIHVVGDLHQPMHAGRAVDLGGNRLYVVHDGERIKLHSFWDSAILEAAHNWSYYQWQQAIDTLPADEADALAAGTIDDWARESVALAARVYDAFPDGGTVTPSQIAEWTPAVEGQLLRGGLRLAALLNALLTPADAVTSHTAAPSPAPLAYNLQGQTVGNTAAIFPGIYITANSQKLLIDSTF